MEFFQKTERSPAYDFSIEQKAGQDCYAIGSQDYESNVAVSKL